MVVLPCPGRGGDKEGVREAGAEEELVEPNPEVKGTGG